MFKRNNGYPIHSQKTNFLSSNMKHTKISLSVLISIFGLHRGIVIHKNGGTNHHALQLPYLLPGLIYLNETRASMQIQRLNNRCFIKALLTTISARNQSKLLSDKPFSLNPLLFESNKRQRYLLINRNALFNKRLLVIRKLQRAIRFFLSKLSLNRRIRALIFQRAMASIIKIQSHIKRFVVNKKVRHYFLFHHILHTRQKAFHTFINKMIQYHNVTKYKELVIYRKIYTFRNYHIVKLQNKYRTHYLSRLVREIISYEKTQYTITYPFIAKEVFFKLYLNSSEEKYHFLKVKNKTRQFCFYYCSLRKLFILYINKYEILQGVYRCHFIVDGCVTCDGRYSYKEHSDGHYYNLMEFKTSEDNEEDHSGQEENSRNTQTDIGSECKEDNTSGVLSSKIKGIGNEK